MSHTGYDGYDAGHPEQGTTQEPPGCFPEVELTIEVQSGRCLLLFLCPGQINRWPSQSFRLFPYAQCDGRRRRSPRPIGAYRIGQHASLAVHPALSQQHQWQPRCEYSRHETCAKHIRAVIETYLHEFLPR